MNSNRKFRLPPQGINVGVDNINIITTWLIIEGADPEAVSMSEY
jgi:hypothetical protein